MTFSRDAHWVWDFWLADDGERFHLYYLHAPTSLGDERLRHRNARVGHATSTDLATWTDLGTVLEPGRPGDFDESATWTGSIVQGPDGLWRMFYTGTRFLSPDSTANVETVGVATSTDLHHWVKRSGPVAIADRRWYETLGDSSWPEEAWRDPWVFADPGGDGWHMLVTARSVLTSDDERDRGVIAHVTSPDLESWTVQAPLTVPGAGFAHLEVPQVATVDGRTVLLFSCDSQALAGAKAGDEGGIWSLVVDAELGPFAVEEATLLTSGELYSGRVIQNRAGDWVLLAFENMSRDGEFGGSITDPIAVEWAGPTQMALGASEVGA